MPHHIEGPTNLHSLVGESLGHSDWFAITQQRVDVFADATEDHQWIHVDPARASTESPYGGPIAHGYLTLSLLSAMWEQILVIDGLGMGVNYGLNKVRFPAAVPVGARVRGHASVLAVREVGPGVELMLTVTVECDGVQKPVCVAEPIFRFYP